MRNFLSSPPRPHCRLVCQTYLTYHISIRLIYPIRTYRVSTENFVWYHTSNITILYRRSSPWCHCHLLYLRTSPLGIKPETVTNMRDSGLDFPSIIVPDQTPSHHSSLPHRRQGLDHHCRYHLQYHPSHHLQGLDHRHRYRP